MLIGITCTAVYLVLSDVINPWVIVVFLHILIMTFVTAGIIALDTYFAFSAFFGFYRIA